MHKEKRYVKYKYQSHNLNVLLNSLDCSRTENGKLYWITAIWNTNSKYTMQLPYLSYKVKRMWILSFVAKNHAMWRNKVNIWFLN